MTTESDIPHPPSLAPRRRCMFELYWNATRVHLQIHERNDRSPTTRRKRMSGMCQEHEERQRALLASQVRPHTHVVITYSSSIFFLIYLLLLKVSLRLPPRRDRGRRIREACGHFRRPRKRIRNTVNLTRRQTECALSTALSTASFSNLV